MAHFFAALLIVFGSFFVLVGSYGLLRFPDFFTRLHGPTKATTLGLAGLLWGFVFWAAGTEEGLSLREHLITVFLFITAPVSAFILARAGLRRRIPSVARRPEPVKPPEER